LVEHFLQSFNEKFGGKKTVVQTAALLEMQNYYWPGNVREVMNILESAYTFGHSEDITLADLPPGIAGQARELPPQLSASRIPTFEETEKTLIANALSATGGNKLRAAKLLGISRKKLYAKIAKHGLLK
jgi:DNA-binding NtrC family response regulator